MDIVDKVVKRSQENRLKLNTNKIIDSESNEKKFLEINNKKY
jgi:hypothetical protein